VTKSTTLGFMCATDLELQETIEEALSSYPALRAVVPADFPRAAWCDVSVERIVGYAEDRKQRYPHLLNLPLALHEALHAEHDDVADLMQALLATLNEFCARFRGRQGAETLLAPLWEAIWTTTPEIWSIAACAFIANRLDANGQNVVGFEMPIGDGADARSPNSDIALKIRETIMHIEVQLWHTASFAGRTDAEIVADLQRRADQKAAKKKLSALPNADSAVIVDVVFVMINDVERDLKGLEDPMALLDRPGAYWIPLRLVGVRDPSLRFELTHF
jgi:hypothetical protein